MACIAVYFLTFSFINPEFTETMAVYSFQAVYIDPIDTVLVALGSLSFTETLRKRNLGHQPKDRTKYV